MAAEMEPGHRSPGQRFWPGGSGHRSVCQTLEFEPVLNFNMRIYRGVFSTH